jgi:phosphoesterase RecJ-like protein
MRLARADFDATGTGVDDLAGLVNEPMSVGSLEVSVLLTEGDPTLTKASFRSKPPASAGAAFVDVNHLAGHFDGGGHVHAAGARIAAPLAEAAARVRSACESYFDSAGDAGVTV